MFRPLLDIRCYPALTLASLLVLAACGKEEEGVATAPPTKVQVVEAQQRSFRPSFEFPAVLEAVETAQIFPRVQARILYQNVTPGQFFNKGEELVKLDPYEFELAVDEAESNVSEAMASYEETSATFKRAQDLRPKGYISEQGYDSAKSAALAAEARLNKYHASLRKARLDLAFTSIVAPFSGRVGALNYAVGDTVSPQSAKPIVEMVKLDPIYALAHVDQKRYTTFTERVEKLHASGQPIPDMELYISLPDGKVYPWQGEFFAWDSTAAATRGTIAGRVLFPNPKGVLVPEETVALHGKLLKQMQGIVIPQKAVSQDQQGHFVYVLDEDGAVMRKNVEVGIRVGPNWSISSGLKTGEVVIVEGLQKVRIGEQVEATPVELEAITEEELPKLRRSPKSLREQLREIEPGSQVPPGAEEGPMGLPGTRGSIDEREPIVPQK